MDEENNNLPISIVLYDCSFDFLARMRQYFKVGVDVEWNDLYFVKIDP